MVFDLFAYDGKLATSQISYQVVEGTVEFRVKNAPQKASAFVTSGGHALYRQLDDNGCFSIPVDGLNGLFVVSVVDGNAPYGTVKLRGFAEKIDDKVIVVFFATDEVVKMYEIVTSLFDEVNGLKEQCRLLNEKFTNMMEGYDLI